MFKYCIFSILIFISITVAAQSPWPSEAWSSAENLTPLMSASGVTTISGLFFNVNTNRLYVCQDEGSTRILQLNTAANTFSQIANLTLSGGPEGITQANLNANEFYVVDEDHYEIRKFTYPANFASAALTNSWNLLASPSPMTNTGNIGPEGITFVPDTFLNVSGFISQATGLPYTSVKGMGGLIFIGNQTQGYVWVFDVNPNVSNDFAYVGKYKTNRSECCDLSFDRSTGLLYILHNINGNILEVTDLSSTILTGSDRKFTVTNEYFVSNPSGNINIEGFAISSRCTDTSTVSAWLCRDVESVESSSYRQDCLRWFNPFYSSLVPAIAITSSAGNTICTGTSVNFTAAPVNGGLIPVYKWKKNGIGVGTNNKTYTTASLLNGDVISCTMTSSSVCPSPTTAASNSITMTVNSALVPSISISANPGNTICTGLNVTFTAVPVNGGITPSYQWKKNNVNVGTNSPTYSINTIVTGDVITCSLTSSLGCASPLTVISSGITMSVASTVSPSISVSASPGNSICTGTNVTFTAAPVNGGSSPSFQWKKNGVNTGTNSLTYTNSSLLNNDVISCVLTSNLSCASPLTASSNNLTITLTPNVTPVISIDINTSTTFCSGTNVTFTASFLNAGTTPSFQWKKNGINVGTNSSTFSSNTLFNGDAINCTMISSAVCAVPSSVTSNSFTVTVIPNVTPSVSINANPGISICPGTNVIFNAVPINGGVSPTYQWKRNGVNVGTNSSSYSSSTLFDNDVIACSLTSNANCPSPSNVTSNALTITVIPNVAPSLIISTNTGTICSGTNVIFNAAPINGGVSPAFQWKINGINAGSNSTSFTSSTLLNNDAVTCVMTSNADCVSPSSASSNTINITVYPNVAPSVNIISNTGNSICTGTSVTFFATPINSGNNPSYQWMKNGVNVGSNSASFMSSSIIDNDHITCMITSNAICALPINAISNSLTMSVASIVTPSITISSNAGSTICNGTIVTINASPINGGNFPSYQWMINGTSAGTNSNVFSTSTLSNGDVVSCTMNSSESCASINPVSSNNLLFTIGQCGVVLNLKVLIQGYYLSSGTMNAVVNPVNYPAVCDSVTVGFYSGAAPYNLVSSVKGTIDIYGNGQFNFMNVLLNQNYYLVINHRNALEVWSHSPQFTSPVMSYDFSTSASKAYGNNLANVDIGVFAMWSGDVTNGNSYGTQDGRIDFKDFNEIQNRIQQFQSGYLICDIDGDAILENSDFSMVENNSLLHITISKP